MTLTVTATTKIKINSFETANITLVNKQLIKHVR